LPEWQAVPGTRFVVDRFGKGTDKVPCKSWFLTHFHSDHYRGLTSKFKAGKVAAASADILIFLCKHSFRPWETSTLVCLLEVLHAGTVYCTLITARLAHQRLKVHNFSATSPGWCCIVLAFMVLLNMVL
jgi:ribonuclease BN (tRNA processing enzyme)